MIYEFKCKATGNLIMTQTVGDQVLDLIGKRSSKGIITVLEMPLLLERLKAALANDKKSSKGNNDLDATQESSSASAPSQPIVSLGQRLVPFIEMLESAHAAEKDVVWGV
jgi:Domain of unknown function (DUF1840)